MPDVAPILIDGAWVSARATATREIRNPATLESLGLGRVRRGRRRRGRGGRGPRPAGLVAGARASRRPATSARWPRKIRAQERELSTLMARETGKPLIEAVDCIEWVAACFDYYAEVGRRSYGTSIPPVAAHQINFTIKEPFGVVAAIVPFNFPLLLMAWKVAPALAAGNTLVCKPPHQNPLSNLLHGPVLRRRCRRAS